MTNVRIEKTAATDAEVREAYRARSRRSFLIGGAAAAAGVAGFGGVLVSRHLGMQRAPLRRGLEWNERLARKLFNERGLAPEYPVEMATRLNVNGPVGLRQELDLARWRLKVVGVARPEQYKQYSSDVTAWQYHEKPNAGLQKWWTSRDGTNGAPSYWDTVLDSAGPRQRGLELSASETDFQDRKEGLLLSLDDLRAIPQRDLVTEFCCIEGWSQISRFGGIRMSDFIRAFPPEKNAQGKLPKYVYMETPFGDFYAGYHIEEIMHPQTLLATTMHGEPLTQMHGAPLRLSMPIKYGYKQIKRIALIAYTDERPDDVWEKWGSDFYAGL